MANRYWVGGTASWDGTAGTKWATTSGGAGGAAVPTSSDNVFFDANSGTVTVTVASGGGICADLDFTGFNSGSTLAGTQSLNIYGSLISISGFTWSHSGALTFQATATGKTATWAGRTMGNSISFTGVGGGWTFQDALTMGTSRNLTLTAGTLDFNDFNVTLASNGAILISGAGTKTLSMGTGTISAGQFQYTGSNLTFNCETSTFAHISSNGFLGGGLTFYNYSNTVAGSPQITGSNTFNNFTRTGTAAKTDSVVFAAGTTQTINGTASISGNSAINRLRIESSTKGTAATLAINGTVSFSNVDLIDSTKSGSASGDISGITGGAGDMGGNTSWTFASPMDCYLKVSANANWSASNWYTTSGGSTPARVPLAQDHAIIDSNSFVGGTPRVITQDLPTLCRVTWSATIGTWATSTACSFVGSISLTSGMTLTSSSQAYTYEGRGSATITSATKSWGGKAFTVDCAGGTLAMGDAFTVTTTFTLTSGTLDLGAFNHSITNFAASSASTATLIGGSGTTTLTGTTGTVLNLSGSGLTYTKQTHRWLISDTGTSTKTLNLGGKYLYSLEISGAASNGAVTISGSNQFANRLKANPLSYVKFTAGTTQTLDSAGVWQMTGTSGNLITIESSSAGSAATISCASGNVVSDYISLKDNTATGGATFYAGSHSTNVSGNTGWSFTDPSAAASQNIICNLMM